MAHYGIVQIDLELRHFAPELNFSTSRVTGFLLDLLGRVFRFTLKILHTHLLGTGYWLMLRQES